jgi:hypothetical protein
MNEDYCEIDVIIYYLDDAMFDKFERTMFKL